jgi:thiamine-phosphate pyrophosphorylase
MAGKPGSRPKPRLYLATPPLTSAEAFASKLAEIIKDVDIAAVLLRLAGGDDAALSRVIAALAPPVQKAGAALLVDGHTEIASLSSADGVHVSDPVELKATLGRFKPDRIVGVGGLQSRHDAMVAAEAGTDYVLFGEPDGEGHRPATEAILERVSWWAELFELPCVAYAATLEEAHDLATAGADFILVGDFIWSDPRGSRVALMDAVAAIGHI